MKTKLLKQGPHVRRVVLLVMLVAIPLVVLRSVNDPINVPKLALLVFGVAVVAAIRIAELSQGADSSGLRRLLVPAAAIALPLLIAWIASPYRGWALFGEYKRFQGLFPYLVLILFGVLIADAFAGHARMLAWGVAGVGGAVGSLALLQVTGLNPFPGYTAAPNPRAAVATLGNPNFTGGFMAIALPLAAGLFLVDRDHRKHAAILGALMTGGLIVSFSQGPYAAAVAGLSVAVAFWCARWRRWVKPLGLALALAVVGLAVASALVTLVAPERSAALPSTIRLRGYWWQSATAMAFDDPLLGSGPNVFGAEGVHYRPLEEALLSGFEFPDDPHSVFFSMLANAGVLGAAGYVALLIWIMQRAWRLESANTLGVAFVAAVVAYFVQGLVSIDELSLRLLFWAVLGGFVVATLPEQQPVKAKAARVRGKKRVERAQPLRAPVAVALVALLPLLAAWWSFNFLRADGRIRHARYLASIGDLPSAEREIELALGFRDDYDYRHIAAFALGNGALDLATEGTEEFEEVNNLLSYTQGFPDLPATRDHARLLQARANKLEATGGSEPEALEKAANSYLRAIEIDPVNPALRAEAAGVLLELDRYEDVEQLLDDYLSDVYADDATLWGALALARAQLGAEEAAQEAIQSALALNGSEPRALEAQELLDGKAG